MNQITKAPETKVDMLKKIMDMPSVQEQFRNALKERSSIFTASLIDLFVSDDTLQKCDPKAVVMEALKAATLNLPINKQLGFAYIIPFNKSVKTASGWEKIAIPTFMIGWRGLWQLATRSGVYKYINAGPVYEGMLRRSNPLTGSLDIEGERTGDAVIGYFAYYETLNGFSKSVFMSMEEVCDHARKYSKAFERGPWKDDFNAMAEKTVIRRLLSRYGQMSVEMSEGLQHEFEPTSDRDYIETANTAMIDIPAPVARIEDTGGEGPVVDSGRDESLEMDAALMAQAEGLDDMPQQARMF